MFEGNYPGSVPWGRKTPIPVHHSSRGWLNNPSLNCFIRTFVSGMGQGTKASLEPHGPAHWSIVPWWPSFLPLGSGVEGSEKDQEHSSKQCLSDGGMKTSCIWLLVKNEHSRPTGAKQLFHTHPHVPYGLSTLIQKHDFLGAFFFILKTNYSIIITIARELACMWVCMSTHMCTQGQVLASSHVCM